jgi:hypothetical protein
VNVGRSRSAKCAKIDTIRQFAARALNLQPRETEIVGRAQERPGAFLNEEEERLDNWRDDARVSYDQQIKALTK